MRPLIAVVACLFLTVACQSDQQTRVTEGVSAETKMALVDTPMDTTCRRRDEGTGRATGVLPGEDKKGRTISWDRPVRAGTAPGSGT